MTLPIKLTSDQITAAGRKKEEVTAFLRTEAAQAAIVANQSLSDANTALTTAQARALKDLSNVNSGAVTAGLIAAGAVGPSALASGSVDATKFAAGVRPVQVVSTLPSLPDATNYPQGAVVSLTSDGKLYRSTGSAWTSAVPTTDLSGTVGSSQIAAGAVGASALAAGAVGSSALAASAVTSGAIAAGAVGASALAGGAVTSGALAAGAVDVTKFAAGIRPIQVLGALPALPDSTNYPQGAVVLLTTDNKLYRSTGPSWTSAVPAADLSGTVGSSQIAAGAVGSSQLAGGAVDATKFASGLVPVQIVSALPALPSSSYPQGAVVTLTTDNKLYRSTGSAWTASVAAADMTGSITTTQITDGAISTPKLAVGAVTASVVAAGAIGTSQLAAGAITAGTIAAGAVGTAALAAGSVTASQIAAGAVTAGALAANAVTAGTVAAGVIGTSQLAAGSVTAGTIAAGAIGTSQLAANAVTAATVAAGAIGTSQLAAGSVTASQIAAGAVTANAIAANSVAASAIAAGAVTADKVSAGAITAASLTVTNPENLWPGGTSEDAPPAGADTTGAEFAGRFNAGAGAYQGSWVRQLAGSIRSNVMLGDQLGSASQPAQECDLSRVVRAGPGESFYIEAQCRAIASPPPAPGSPTATAQATGGTLSAGTRRYKVSAVVGGVEGNPSAEVSATVAANGSVLLGWAAVANASKYFVYEGSTAGGENVFWDVGNVTSWTDIGTAGTAGTPFTNDGVFGVYIQFLDQNGSLLSASPVATPVSAGTTTWTKATAYSTAPAGTCYVRGYCFQHSLGTTQFDNIYFTRQRDAGTITAGAIKTSNYAEDGSGNPTSGAKLDNVGSALKVAAGNFQIGTYTFDAGGNAQFWGRLKNALTNVGNEYWYVGSSTGAPALNWSIAHHGIHGSTGYGIMTVGIYAPYGLSNNFDGVRYMSFLFYNSSSVQIDGPKFGQLPDQRHDQSSGADNSIRAELTFGVGGASYNLVSGLYTFNGFIRTQMYNSTGYSTAADFDCRSTAFNNNFTFLSGGIPGAAPPPSGGGGGAGACPAPQTKIQLSSGLWVDAADVHDGMEVRGFDEHDVSKPRVGIVRHPVVKWEERYDLALESGRVLKFSKNHRLVSDSGWKEIQNLRPGNTLPTVDGKTETVKLVKRIGLAPIVAFRVEGCSTYFSDGVASHNYKP